MAGRAGLPAIRYRSVLADDTCEHPTAGTGMSERYRFRDSRTQAIEPNHSQKPRIGSAGVVLIIAGILGCGVVVLFAAIFPIIAVEEPKAREIVGIVGLALPFVFYIVAIGRRWSRQWTLGLGIPVHAAWFPLVKYPGDEAQFLLTALALFSLFLWYALRLPRIRQGGPS